MDEKEEKTHTFLLPIRYHIGAITAPRHDSNLLPALGSSASMACGGGLMQRLNLTLTSQ